MTASRERHGRPDRETTFSVFGAAGVARAAVANPSSMGTRRTTGSVPPGFSVDRGATSSLTKGLAISFAAAAVVLPNGSTTT